MGNLAKTAVVAVLVGSLTGCYGIRYNASSLPDDAASMTSVSTGIEGRHFVTKRKVSYLFWGLLPLSSLDLAQVIRQEAGQRRAVNLQIQSAMAPMDGLIWVGGGVAATTLLSLVGLAAVGPLVGMALVPHTQTITIEGDLIQEGGR